MEYSISFSKTESSINSNQIILNLRSETVMKIKIINSHLKAGICPDNNILVDLILCPSIVKVTDEKYALKNYSQFIRKTREN